MSDHPLPRLEADWMTEPEIATLLQALDAAGGHGRFVGGCVRDTILDRPVTDIDVAVDLEPDTVVRALKAADVRTVPTGIEHGTITAILPDRAVEVTSLRRDVETDGRRAVVAYTKDWRDDSMRRDFTVNALYADADGALADFHGGFNDLKARRLRFIGNPDLRIREDVLRILRFFRFHAQLEIPAFDPDGLDACLARRALLPELSAERVATELLKLLATPDPLETLAAMIGGGFLAHWLPEATDLSTLDDLLALERKNGEQDPIRRLAALCPSDPTAMQALADRLRLSSHDRDRLKLLGEVVEPPPNDAVARRLVYELGLATARDIALLGCARDADTWQTMLTVAETWPLPIFPLKGQDVLDRGATPGPEIGSILASLERSWTEDDFSEDRAALLRRLDQMLKE